MAYTVLARKYRPKTFDEIVAQEAAATTLRHAVESDRVGHAYLFAGPRGVGKTSMARILAKALNCAQGPTATPCNECERCVPIDRGDDIDVIEIDGASNNGVEQVRTLRENAQYMPSRSPYKIYYIDEVHMLSGPAFNALLKILEEPPPHVKFFFSTTAPQKIPDTVRSRCQRFDFHRIPGPAIIETLAAICQREEFKVEPEALAMLARSARGSMRDGLSLLDQMVSASPQGKISADDVADLLGALPRDEIFTLADALIAGDAKTALERIHRAFAEGINLESLAGEILEHLRLLLILAVAGRETRLLEEDERTLERLEEQQEGLSVEALLYGIQMLAEAQQQCKENPQNRVPIELAVLQLTRLKEVQPLSEVLARLEALEKRLAAGSGATGSEAPAMGIIPLQGKVSEKPAGYAAKSRKDATPTPEPVAVPAAPAQRDDAWAQVLDRIAGERPTLAALLEGLSVLGIEDTVLTLGGESISNHRRRGLEDPETVKLIERCAAGVYGQKRSVRFSWGRTAKGQAAKPALRAAKPAPRAAKSAPGAAKSAPRPAKPQPPPADRGSTSDGPAVERAMELFGGQLVNDEE